MAPKPGLSTNIPRTEFAQRANRTHNRCSRVAGKAPHEAGPVTLSQGHRAERQVSDDDAIAGFQRRLRPPPALARADKMPGGYVVRDANGQALAHLYSRDNEAEARQAKVLTTAEARRVAINIARLPALLGKGESD
jgi:hypothetical protein